MATQHAPLAQSADHSIVYAAAYRTLGYLGVLSIAGALVFGFRYSPAAATLNVSWNVGLYALFIVPHLIMTRSWFKRTVWGHSTGHPRERRFYIFVTLISWWALLILQRPVPGPSLALPPYVHFLGVLIFLLGFMLFFEGVTREKIDGLLGVPGNAGAFSHGPETPLFTEGAYAEVRHPMYRAFMIQALGSLLIHPNAAQLLWASLLAGTFIAFIPVEEAQLMRARGDDYRQYRTQTPYRLFRRIW